MLERLLHLVSGECILELEGDALLFFNAAARRGFLLWGFSSRGERARVRCRPEEQEALLALAARCRVKVTSVHRRGLPYRLAFLKRRPGLPVGVILGLALFWYLSGGLWGLSVSGTDRLGDSMLLKAAGEIGLRPGMRLGDLDPGLAGEAICAAVPELSWASVNTDGCRAVIAVKEKEARLPDEGEQGLSNLIAARPGLVLWCEAESGRPEVQPGQAVGRGELLVSGVYKEKLDPWGPQREPLFTIGRAKGRVIAQTFRDYEITVPARLSQEVPGEQAESQKSLVIFGIRIPLGLHTAPSGKCSISQKQRQLTLFGQSLPMTLEERVLRPITPKTRTLSPDEQRRRALFLLRARQREELAGGGEIEEEELSWISGEDGALVLISRCTCREDIAVEQKILVNIPQG